MQTRPRAVLTETPNSVRSESDHDSSYITIVHVYALFMMLIPNLAIFYRACLAFVPMNGLADTVIMVVSNDSNL
jgi:hypothetical protein